MSSEQVAESNSVLLEPKFPKSDGENSRHKWENFYINKQI